MNDTERFRIILFSKSSYDLHRKKHPQKIQHYILMLKEFNSRIASATCVKPANNIIHFLAVKSIRLVRVGWGWTWYLTLNTYRSVTLKISLILDKKIKFLQVVVSWTNLMSVLTYLKHYQVGSEDWFRMLSSTLLISVVF